MEKVSLKQIVNAIQDMSIQTRREYANHLQVNGFSFGNVSKINTLEISGIHLHLQPTVSPITSNISELTFNIYVMDLIDEDNLLDVMNDTVEVIVDLLKKLSSSQFKSEYSFKLVNSTDITPFEGAFDQLTAGWVSTLTFEVFNGSTCKTAFAKYYDITWTTGKPGKTYYTFAEIHGDMSNMIAPNQQVYLSFNGDREEMFKVELISGVPSVLTFDGTLSTSYNKLRIKNK